MNDENGINISANGIGHDITLIMNDNHAEVMNLTDYFEPTIDNYQKGELSFPFYNLPDGDYTLTLKAWDNFNNSSEKSIAFRINTSADLDLYNVMCFPNPFTDHTTFSFSHTKPGAKLNVVMEIYNGFGKFVLSYETTLYSSGTKMDFLDWNGRDINGNKIPKGIYIYTLVVTDEVGDVSRSQQKFIIR
ncbi:MAG: FlgD immunoglobulin-like domain containing protein [Bacteroidales bacterium]